MPSFERLRAIRLFEKEHAGLLGRGEDYYLVGEIGYQQARGSPLTLKQLLLLDIGSIATIQRRLRRLKTLGLVKYRRVKSDRRAVQLTLTPKCLRIFSAQGSPKTSKTPAQRAAVDSREPSHLCGLCDSTAARRNLLVTFLAQGMQRGDLCFLVAPADEQGGILAELPHLQAAAGQLVVSEGHDSPEAQFAFLKRVAQQAKQAGRAMCLAADMSWTRLKNLRLDAVLDIEKRLDALAGQLPLTALCVYDARHFSSGDFLHAVKCHRDHARHPIVLG